LVRLHMVKELVFAAWNYHVTLVEPAWLKAVRN
jgi:hypothetical protein